ncbi:MAG: ribonuclease D [Syntrophales bacterium]|nr:ribonuclease D [Syntrophales bacterium]
MNKTWVWVDDTLKLHRAENDISSTHVIGIDTEYDSLRYFREKLCLIQIKTEEKTYLLDPLDRFDLSFLGDSFAKPSVLKIMHAADNDIRLLKRDYGFEFRNLFDTQRAAFILGDQNLSLSTLVEKYLGIDLKKKKKTQRSLWNIRPLTDEQLNYAIQDTAYLLELYQKLEAEIQQKGLDAEAVKVFDAAASVRWHEKKLDPRGHLKIKGYQELTLFERQRLKELFRWRFQKAKESNRAFFLILSDQEIVNLSKTSADSIKALNETGILSPEKLDSIGPEIVETLQQN